MKHLETHPFFVEDCFGCKLMTIFCDRYSAFEAEKNKNQELALFKRAVDEGSLPWGTQTKQSIRALSESDRLGRPFRADDMATTYHPDVAKELIGKPPITLEKKEE